jgi:DNA-binding LacI/PurR family transcriptional regulator
VPDDISVTGIDDIDVAQFYNPALTTVRVPKKAMAERAAAILMKLMNRESVLSEDLVVDFPTQLVVRQSTSQCRS